MAFTPGQEITLPQDSSVKAGWVVGLEYTDKYWMLIIKSGNFLLSCTQEAQFLFYSLEAPTNPKLLKTFTQVHLASPLSFQIYGE